MVQRRARETQQIMTREREEQIKRSTSTPVRKRGDACCGPCEGVSADPGGGPLTRGAART